MPHRAVDRRHPQTRNGGLARANQRTATATPVSLVVIAAAATCVLADGEIKIGAIEIRISPSPRGGKENCEAQQGSGSQHVGSGAGSGSQHTGSGAGSGSQHTGSGAGSGSQHVGSGSQQAADSAAQHFPLINLLNKPASAERESSDIHARVTPKAKQALVDNFISLSDLFA